MAELNQYRPEHRPGILKLLDDAPFKDRIWDWQFEDPAMVRDFDPVVLVEGDRVVGFNGVMPARMIYLGERVDGIWSCDFYVDASFRGQGLGRTIKEALMEKGPVIMSFGVSARAASVLGHMGWRRSPDVWTYRHLRRSQSLRDHLLRCLQFLNRLTGGSLPAHQGHLQWQDSLPEAAEVDALWESICQRFTKAVVRDYQYLDWRYQRHPLADYRFLVARDADEKLEAVMVVRVNEATVRVVDWVGAPDESALMRSMVTRCMVDHPNATVFTVTTSSAAMGKAFEHCGFFRGRTQPAFFVRSALPDDADPEQGWFIMGGDSDGELLLAARERFSQGDGQ
ncbi:hypothetical protein CK501_06485 [Halovibrio salipaludis]|uniref:N-acetyltransferase domain-containing protein n=1 Tax=Halovibrio salipaludis TaxID=2032626 RepID=A0A2A2F9C3_9GAMM|nr:GNAT family N-acetyltransferase [Halovibrio salipaludis]PAU81202.1 hypothetical protein CK501_06485 [Halovibrio salipaludis]